MNLENPVVSDSGPGQVREMAGNRAMASLHLVVFVSWFTA